MKKFLNVLYWFAWVLGFIFAVPTGILAMLTSCLFRLAEYIDKHRKPKTLATTLSILLLFLSLNLSAQYRVLPPRPGQYEALKKDDTLRIMVQLPDGNMKGFIALVKDGVTKYLDRGTWAVMPKDWFIWAVVRKEEKPK